MSASQFGEDIKLKAPSEDHCTAGGLLPNADPGQRHVSIVEDDDDYDGSKHPVGFRPANSGDMAERSGVPHDAEFALPSPCDPEFSLRFFGNRNNNVQQIARKTGTHISMPVNMDDPVLSIWGTPENVAIARSDLQLLFQHVGMEIDAGARRVPGWAKVRAGPTARRQALIDELARNAKIRQYYRRNPPEGSVFNHVGLFVWPSREMNPRVSLGMALEALDEIRFDQRVFITFWRNRDTFRIMGEDTERVQIAIDRIFGTFREITSAARRPTSMCLIKPPYWLNMAGTRVIAIDNHTLIDRQVSVKRTVENKGIQVFLGGEMPDNDFTLMWRVKFAALEQANEAFLRKAFERALIDLQYYRGYAKLRVYIGRMVFYGYRRAQDGAYGLLEFAEMARNPRTAGEVIRDIGNERYRITDKDAAEEIITRCALQRDIFQPVNPNPDRNDEIEPETSATFNIRLSNDRNHPEDVRLVAEFQRIPGTKEYRVLNHRWLVESPDSDYDPGNLSSKGPVDVKLIDLDADLACQFKVATWPLYRETDNYPIFAEFERGIGLEEIPDELHSAGPPLPGYPDSRPKILRVTFVSLPGLSVTSVVQKTKWRYWMSNTSYMFELTRYDMLLVDEVNPISTAGVPVSWGRICTPLDTRWGCSLGNTKWDENLHQQPTISLGYKATWDPNIDQFFEATGSDCLNNTKADWGADGFKEFIVRVKEAVVIIKEAQRQAAFNRLAIRAPMEPLTVPNTSA